MGFFDSLFGVNKARDAIRNAGAQAQGTLQSGYEDVAVMYAPYVQGGQQAFGTLQNLAGLNGPGQAGVAYDQFRQSPGYMAGLTEGIGAIDRSAVGRGGLNSGNTMRDLTRFATDYADRGFGDYYNRIAGIGNVGYGATNAQAGARQGTAQGIAGIQRGVGEGEANASLAGGGLMMGGLNTLAGLAGFGLGGGFGGGGFGVPTSKPQQNVFYGNRAW